MKFVSRPVEVEAHQWDGTAEAHAFLRDWTDANVNLVTGGQLQVRTLEGPIYASVGDWIIKGLRGEFYPCKPDIFEAKYDPVDTSQN